MKFYPKNLATFLILLIAILQIKSLESGTLEYLENKEELPAMNIEENTINKNNNIEYEEWKKLPKFIDKKTKELGNYKVIPNISIKNIGLEVLSRWNTR